MEDVALTNSLIENTCKQEQLLHDLNELNINSSSNLLTNKQNKKSKNNKLVEIIDLDQTTKMQTSTSPTLTRQSNIQTISESSKSRKPSNSEQSPTESSEESSSKLLKKNKCVKITSRIVFLKVGQIDTRNERFDAEAFIECTWEDDVIFKILSDPNMAKNIQGPNALEVMLKQAETASLNSNNLINLKNIINNISLLEYDPNVFWSPQLYIENAIGDLKEEIRHRLEIVEREGSNLLDDPNYNPKNEEFKELIDNLTVRVCEMRKLRGVFYERLELYDFPMDMQELSITLTSKRNSSEVQIVENLNDACSINTEDFLDQQEWDLFSHVKTTQKTIYDPWRKYERTGFSVSCYIARKPGYYLYNAYMLIFLITMLGFVPFAFDSGAPQFRCQVTGLLLLTSVNFRWIVTQRIPSVPYLTSLDKYAIGSLLYLVLFCVWHSIIGSNIITSDKDIRKNIDSRVLYGSAVTCFIYNLFYIIWFIKMSKSIKKFRTDGLKQASAQAELREKLNSKFNSSQSSGASIKPDHKQIEDYESLQKSVRKSQSMKFTKNNQNNQQNKQIRVASQPNAHDPTLLLTSA